MQKVLLAVCVVGVPLTHGWAQESGIAILFFASACLAVIGALRFAQEKQHQRVSLWPLVIAAVACLIVGFQLVPLPETMLGMVSPAQKTLFAERSAFSGELGVSPDWKTISLTPHLTASCLALVTAYFFLILGLWFFGQSRKDVLWLLRLIAISTLVMASVGLIQLLFGNGKFLGLFENPMRTAGWPAKGTFTNQNHFANFLAVGLGACFYQFLGQQDDRKKQCRAARKTKQTSFEGGSSSKGSFTSLQLFWAVAVVVISVAAILSFSRGGIAAFLISLGISCFAFRSKIKALSRFAIPATGFCVVAVVVFGSDVLASRWNHLVTSSSLSDISKGRVVLWQSLLEAIPSFLVAGSGAGSHAEVYPTWIREDFGKRFSHAENGYLQILLEMGLPGAILLGATVFLTFRLGLKAFRSSNAERQPLFLVCGAGITASLLHSMMDFAWYIPGCLILTLTLLFVVYRGSELELPFSGPDRSTHSRWLSLPAIAIIVAATTLGAPQIVADARSEGSWLEYRGIAIQARKANPSAPPTAEQLEKMIAALETCLKCDPADTRALSDLAVLYLQRFEMTQAASENPMSVSEIRSTVQSVGFANRREMLQWMVKAFGGGVGDLFRSLIASKQALAGQPLRATSYLALHELSFLLTGDQSARTSLMQQVLTLRPHDAAVRYTAGLADLEAGRTELGFQRLAFAFREQLSLREPILRQLLDAYGIREALKILEPNEEQLLAIFNHCQAAGKNEESRLVAEKFSEAFTDKPEQDTYSFWLSASKVFALLNDHQQEIHCFQKALLYRPETYWMRRELAFRLSEYGDPQAAEAALRACLVRKPDDSLVMERLKQLPLMTARSQKGRFQ